MIVRRRSLLWRHVVRPHDRLPVGERWMDAEPWVAPEVAWHRARGRRVTVRWSWWRRAWIVRVYAPAEDAA